jgi:phosphoesterase RecJ-like protein
MVSKMDLSKVKTIVSHLNCADGIMSALIAKFWTGAEIKFLQYNTPEMRELKAEPGMLFVDFSPPADRAEEFRKVDAIVFDHHITQEDIIKSFEHHVYGDAPGVSGAVITYNEFYKYAQIFAPFLFDFSAFEPLATLVGIRDTWVKTSPLWDMACNLQSGLLFYPMTYWQSKDFSCMPHKEIEVFFNNVMQIGSISIVRHQERCQHAVDKGLRFTTSKGQSVCIIDGISLSSDASDLAGTDLLVAFGYTVENDVPKMIVSCRSRSGFNVSEFAKHFGGGGHIKAAGCSVPVKKDPYSQIQDMFAEYGQ